MKWLPLLVLLLGAGAARAAPPHLDLEVTLDPATRHFQAKADLATSGRPDPAVDRIFKVSRVAVKGGHLTMEYSGTLPALPQGQQGGSPNPSPIFASVDGSYLAAGAGWYPDPGVPFTYRLKVSVPAGQKAVAPGKQVRAGDSGGRWVAQYEFSEPAEGISLMAGPYQLAQRALQLDNGKTVTVRTWFHPELAGLANDYLQDSARYIERYSRSIGAYPFSEFSIVSSPLSHGLGMPSLTYLGRDVLRLPFIRATSLGHEVLHNWWGNGVYPEWSTGNWSEGLTTFMADYAYREDQSAEAARETRLNWLRDLTAIAPSDETSLAKFTARHHGISSVIGYGKSAMLFFMVRDEIGPPAFEQGLRLFWQRYRFKSASWKDLERVFSQAARRDLSGFFAQWTARASSPALDLAPAEGATGKGRFQVVQQGEPFELAVPLRIKMQSGESRDVKLRVHERQTPVDLAALGVPAGASEVQLDPDLRLWRRLDPRFVPPIFREAFISPRAQVFIASVDPQWTAPAMALAGRLLDARPRQVSQTDLQSSPELPALVMGDRAGITALLPRLGLELPEVLFQPGTTPAGPERPLKGNAQAWTARAASGKTFAFVMAGTPALLASLQRSMPHYGRQSWLVFEDGRVGGQGAWPAPVQALKLQ